MKVAVISDVHGNDVALEAVLKAVERENVDELWFLGDAVDYGARPERCVDLLRRHADLALAGNHDLAVLGKTSLANFRRDLLDCIAWTKEQLSDESAAWLASKSCSAERGPVGLYHGSPRDPVWEYVIDTDLMRRALEQTDHQIVLVGHSHLAFAMRFNGTQVIGDEYSPDKPFVIADHRFVINPGSVGQPRDRDPRASFLVLDLGRGTGRFHRAEYDIAAAEKAILEAGITPLFASRLWYGS